MQNIAGINGLLIDAETGTILDPSQVVWVATLPESVQDDSELAEYAAEHGKPLFV